jgi:hypothetical protein
VNQNTNFPIGVTKFGGGIGRGKWFRLEQGDNYYRILPPYGSLAVEGRYSHYWAFHGGFKNSEGITQMFRCIEKKDKNKVITTHCPVCDLVASLMLQHENAKSMIATGQVTKEQVDAFWDQQIFPIKAQKAFFVNAVNQQGEVGVLQLPYKAHQALDQLLKTAPGDANIGLDLTGMRGGWVKIKKVQPFKGSKDVTFGAEVVYERTSAGLAVKTHDLTPEFIQTAVIPNARDLLTLFRSISPEDVAALAACQTTQDRAKTVDRVFGKKEPQPAENPLVVGIPGTTATMQGRVENRPDGTFGVVMPAAPQQLPFQTATGVPATGPIGPTATPANFPPPAQPAWGSPAPMPQPLTGTPFQAPPSAVASAPTLPTNFPTAEPTAVSQTLTAGQGGSPFGVMSNAPAPGANAKPMSNEQFASLFGQQPK